MSEATAPNAAEERGIVARFAHNTVAANLVMAVMLIGGFAAVTQLTAQVFPTVDPGVVTVSVPYPGATPTEVAEGITRRVEEAVLGIDGVDRVVSKASENMGSVTIELKDFVDASKVRDDVESAVQQIADFPPEDAEEPDIVRAETISDVMTLVVSGALSEKDLRRAAELVEEELLALPAVTLVSLVGARDYEIAIEVREEALRRYGLTIAQVANAVRASSLTTALIVISGGGRLARSVWNTIGSASMSTVRQPERPKLSVGLPTRPSFAPISSAVPAHSDGKKTSRRTTSCRFSLLSLLSQRRLMHGAGRSHSALGAARGED